MNTNELLQPDEKHAAAGKRPASMKLIAMTRCALLAAVLIIAAQLSFPLPVSPVPVTLQSLAVMLIAVLLTQAEALCAVGVYIIMGLIGLPVFAGFQSGISRLIGPTGGFIIGFLPSAWCMALMLNKKVVNLMAHKNRLVRYLWLIFAALVFSVILYAFGVVWFMIGMGANFSTAMSACVLPFLPGAAVKGAAILLIYPALMRLKRIMYRSAKN